MAGKTPRVLVTPTPDLGKVPLCPAAFEALSHVISIKHLSCDTQL